MSILRLTLFLILVVTASLSWASETPRDFKVAFIGDQGMSKDAKALLRLIKSEGAGFVLHAGDLDYHDSPFSHERQINNILGKDFPYVVLIGNHDKAKWYGEGGYADYARARLERSGIEFKGAVGVHGTFKYKGLNFVITAPGIVKHKGKGGYKGYIERELDKDDSLWSICAWHKNQRTMQSADKGNETGWGVYEACRKGGAIIVTGHSHTYSRTHLLSDMSKLEVADRSNAVTIKEGETIALVSGLGGHWRRPGQRIRGGAPWMAMEYTDDQEAEAGALFCEFNKGGRRELASCYFKNIKGQLIDEFTLISGLKQ